MLEGDTVKKFFQIQKIYFYY